MRTARSLAFLSLLILVLTAGTARAVDEKTNPLRRAFEFSMDRPADTIDEKDNTFKLAIPKKYHDEITGTGPVSTPRELKITLKFQNINTNYTYILFNNQGQKTINPAVVKTADAIGGVTPQHSFSFAKPTGALQVVLPLDKETAPTGQLELTIRTINSMGKTSDPDDAPVKRLRVDLEPARIDYEVSAALTGPRAGVVFKAQDFKPDYKLVRLGRGDKVADRQVLSREARGKELRFEFDTEGKNRSFRFCLAPNFGYAYPDPKLLQDDVVCDEVTYKSAQPAKEETAQELFKAPEKKAEAPKPAETPKPAEEAAPAEDKPQAADAPGAAEPAQEAKAQAEAKPGDKPKPGMDLSLLKQGKFCRVSVRSDADPGQDTVFLDDRDIGGTPTADQAIFTARDIPLKIAFTRAGKRNTKGYTVSFTEGKFKVCHQSKCEEYPMNFLEKGVVWLYVKEDRKQDFKFSKHTD